MALAPKRIIRKLAVLAKIETTYGTDAVPTGAANAIQMNQVTITPFAGDEAKRDLNTPYLGHQGMIPVGTYVELQGQVELAGAGTAGDAPGYGVLLRACGLAETLIAGTSAVYEPVSASQEAASLYANLDGVNHVLLGARGTVTLDITPKQIPHFSFTLRGLLGPIADTMLPATDYSGFMTPLPVSKVNTPVFSIHGFPAIAESFQMDIANTVETRNLIGEDSIQITDRQTTGTAVLEATSLAAKDWFSAALSTAKGALSIQHGTTAGNIVEISAPKVQIGRPTYGNTQGIANLSLPLMFTPDTGDDEFAITIR